MTKLSLKMPGFKLPAYGNQVWILLAGTIVATIGSNMVMPFLSRMIAGISGIAMIYLSMVIITLAEMLWSPASAALQANMSPEKCRGRYFGFGSLMFSIGFAIGPLFGGLVKDSMGENVQVMWLIIGGMFIISMMGFMLLSQIIPPRVNKPTQEEKEIVELVEIKVETV